MWRTSDWETISRHVLRVVSSTHSCTLLTTVCLAMAANIMVFG